MIKRLQTITLFTIFCFFAMDAVAQSGRITGKVVDAGDGEPLIGVNVFIQGTTQGANTNLDGEYRILNVSPGTYTLEYRFIGYRSQIIEDVLVRTDLNTEIDVELSEQVIEGEEVIVRAVRDVVIKDLTSSESRVSRDDLERLPVQEVSDVIQLQSGVTTGPGGSIHIRGGRATEVSYVVDGVRVTDSYDRSSGLRVENQSIEEIQVVSGTFNAEFGQATSGIINIATRSGSNQFRGNVRVWGGDYGTDRSNLFVNAPQNFEDVDPASQYNFEASFSGPIIEDKLTFFVSGRRFNNDGWLYGFNAFSPQGPIGPDFDATTQTLTWERGFSEVPANNPVNRYGQRVDPDLPWIEIVETVSENGTEFIRYRDTGRRDSSLVPLNSFNTLSFQGNLQWNASQLLRFNLIGNYGTEKGKGYDHSRKLIANSVPTQTRDNYYLNFKSTITPTASTFLTTNVAFRSNQFERSLFDSPFDRRFFNFDRSDAGFIPLSFRQGQAGRFDRFGTRNDFFNRRTETLTVKSEISSQVNNQHFLKGGVELQADILDFQSFGLAPRGVGELPSDLPEDKLTGPRALELSVPAPNTPGHEKWTRKPVLLSAFLQDRIEFSNFIINIGLRYDYFKSNGRVPRSDRPNLTQALAERPDDFWKEVSAKSQLSPRFGIAYPISENGVVHFSYGYFFQIPDYNKLFNGDNLILESTSGTQGIFGNPDLKPEQSIKYELGLQQEVFTGTALDVTIFFEDKRDFISSGPTLPTASPTVRFGTWINRDFANIKGITASLNQRITRAVTFGFDYTFSVAEDSNSDPSAEFFQAIARDDTAGTNLAKFLTPANWDRTHVFNSSLFYAASTWGFNLTQRFSTGLPYTPSTDLPRRVGISSSGSILTNSVRMPDAFSIDLNMFKNFNFTGYELRFFFNVFNLLDNDNLSFVYNDSGSPELPLRPPDDFDPGFFNNPSFYGEPRRVQIGVQMSF